MSRVNFPFLIQEVFVEFITFLDLLVCFSFKYLSLLYFTGTQPRTERIWVWLRTEVWYTRQIWSSQEDTSKSNHNEMCYLS